MQKKKKLANKYGPWVSGEDFFNRDKEKALLTEQINNDSNLLMVAPRRVGKTSLIRETFRLMETDSERYFLFLDIQDCASPEDVIVALSKEAFQKQTLLKQIKDYFGSFLKRTRQTVESLKMSEILEMKLREDIYGDWQFKGESLLESLAKANHPIVICLDELPIMISRVLSKSEEEGEGFLSWLRKMMGQHQKNINFIICGSIGLEPILQRYSLSHTIGHLQPFHLDSWNAETASDCLDLLAKTKGFKWSDELSLKIVELLGVCVPHHVQMFFGSLYNELFLAGRNDPSISDIEQVYQKSMLSTRGHAELSDYEDRLLRVFDKKNIPLALDLLSEAAIQGVLTRKTCNILGKRLGITDKAIMRELLAVLEHDGYLVWDEKSKTWGFASNLIRDWWKKRFSQSYIAPENEKET